MLSIGGRTTLLSSVLGALGTYYFSLFPLPKCTIKTLESIRAQFFWGNDGNTYKIPWIAWNSTLASKAKGGLGIGSLESLNHALIQRWRWRFLNTPNALWVMTIKAIHGLNGDSSIVNCSVKGNGVWARIVKDVNAMNDQGFIPHHFIKRNVRDGRTTRFWKDHWMGVASLQHQFPRLFRLEVNKDCMVRDRWNDGWNWIWSRPIPGGITSTQLSTLTTLLDPIILTEGRDEWVWLLDPNNGFTVKKTCIHLDNASLPDAYISTRWCRFIPKKVNIFVWRALRDRLPTRWNLSNKGVEIESILCPTCSSSPETIQHSLWTCSLATCVWLKVFSWLDLLYPTPSSLQDVFAYVDQLHIHNDRKLMLQAIFGVVLWTLWSFRNHLIFNSHPMARNEIFDKVTSTSFLWYTNRNRKANISWNNWLQNPLIPYIL